MEEMIAVESSFVLFDCEALDDFIGKDFVKVDTDGYDVVLDDIDECGVDFDAEFCHIYWDIFVKEEVRMVLFEDDAEARRKLGVGSRAVESDFREHLNLLIGFDDHNFCAIASILWVEDIQIGILRRYNEECMFSLRCNVLSRRVIVRAFRKKFKMYQNVPIYIRKSIKRDGDKYLPSSLLKFDYRVKEKHFEFGVLSFGTTSEHDKCSVELEIFLECIAEKISVKNFDRFHGKLDQKNGTTGSYSYYTEYRDYEIMFQVQPLLSDKETQIRLLSNNSVLIVFIDDPEIVWNPINFDSRVIHAQLIIKPVYREEELFFRVVTMTKSNIPRTIPIIPQTFNQPDENFREFILEKCIQLHRACYTGSEFLKEHHDNIVKDSICSLFDDYKDGARKF